MRKSPLRQLQQIVQLQGEVIIIWHPIISKSRFGKSKCNQDRHRVASNTSIKIETTLTMCLLKNIKAAVRRNHPTNLSQCNSQLSNSSHRLSNSKSSFRSHLRFSIDNRILIWAHILSISTISPRHSRTNHNLSNNCSLISRPHSSSSNNLPSSMQPSTASPKWSKSSGCKMTN